MDEKTIAGIAGLEPHVVWECFAGLSAVPRPSKKEERARAHVTSWAGQRGFATRQDAAGNVLITVPASKGRERARAVVLQGHLDMVCEKNSGTEHDFDRDPISLLQDREGEEPIVRAKGTTLGADNGMGVSLAMGTAISPEVIHGPLELLLTVDEEAGMSGAQALAPGFFEGRILLNLDGGDDGTLVVGCAGGCDVTLDWTLPKESPAAGWEFCRLAVSGLRGGHSGVDIHQNRGNAIRLLVQTLFGLRERGIRLAALHGGGRRNAIAREASAVLQIPPGTGDALRRRADEARRLAETEHGEKTCAIEVQPLAASSLPAAVLSVSDSAGVLAALAGLPHGVLAVVPEIPGLVQTSNNLATVATSAEGTSLHVEVGCMARSFAEPMTDAALRQITAVGELAGARVRAGHRYPGWRPDFGSPLLDVCRRTHKKVFSMEPTIEAVHAGLECGVIGERIPGMDMISMGPRIRGEHSPDERVYVSSVQRTWSYLTALLQELTEA